MGRSDSTPSDWYATKHDATTTTKYCEGGRTRGYMSRLVR
jgi:hypothetical protein